MSSSSEKEMGKRKGPGHLHRPMKKTTVGMTGGGKSAWRLGIRGPEEAGQCPQGPGLWLETAPQQFGLPSRVVGV